MKRKAQATKSPVQEVKPAILAITVQDHDLLALHKLLRHRKRITRKMRELPKLEPRLKIENPELSLQQLADRLQRDKATTDKAIAEYSSSFERKRGISSLPKPRAVSFMKESRSMTTAEILHEHTNRMSSYWRDVLSQLLQSSDCSAVTGRATPFLCGTGYISEDLSDLNHDSSIGYGVDLSTYSMGTLGYVIGAWLNDDASIWRNDNPDTICWYDDVYIQIPPAQCDSIIVASLSFRFSGEIESEADDHNEINQYVYVAHSDENGIFPCVPPEEGYHLNNLDLSGEIGLPFGNRFDSGWVTAYMSFNVEAGISPMVAVANRTDLCAQDGTLSIIGTWRITDLYYSITPI